MISISKDEWINPETIESMYVSHEGVQLFMVSGRVIQIIDNSVGVMREIEEYFGKKMGIVVPEPKPKRKYTKKVKNEEGGAVG